MPTNISTDAMTERALDALDVLHGRDRDGDLHSRIPLAENGTMMGCWFFVEGENRSILRLLCKVSQKIPQRNWPAALQFCNTFHEKVRFGRGILHIQEGQEEGTLDFDAQVDCDGIPEEFLQTWLGLHLAAACRFFEMADDDPGLSLDHRKATGMEAAELPSLHTANGVAAKP